jgi:hypothetical protein
LQSIRRFYDSSCARLLQESDNEGPDKLLVVDDKEMAIC